MRYKFLPLVLSFSVLGGILVGCAQVSVPESRRVDIPNPVAAEARREAINEKPDSVMYLPLGEDVLVPERMVGENLPKEIIGPFELRGETLAGALQLILADYDISIAFESDLGLTRKVTVANLKGSLDKVVNRVCSLADLYCSYEDGTLVVKETQTFTVSLPPLGDAEGGQEFIDDVIAGLSAVIGGSGSAPVSDPTTRTIIYSASQRTSQLAENYFERLRASTAMIVFETYIWEVSLNSGNSTGVDWSKMKSFGKFNTDINISGSVSSDFTNPVSIGLPTTGAVDPTELIQFLSQFGAVKTISQPQITVLSGSSASLRVADTENYVSEVSSTFSGDNTTTSVTTDSVDSGFTLDIGSSWDKSTVYANVNINLTNVDDIEDFAFDTDGAGGSTTIQLPQTTERELETQIRVRPGDSVLIAGLVRERDNFNSRGPGFMRPVVPDSRTAETDNLELVILLRPRVIVYTASDNQNYKNFVNNKAEEMLSQRLASKAPIAVVPKVAVAPVPQVAVAPISATPAPVPVYTPPAPRPVASPPPRRIAAPAPPSRAIAPTPAPPPVADVVAPVVAPVVSSGTSSVKANPYDLTIEEFEQYDTYQNPSMASTGVPTEGVSPTYQAPSFNSAPSASVGAVTPSYQQATRTPAAYTPSSRVSNPESGYTSRYDSGNAQPYRGYDNTASSTLTASGNVYGSMPKAVVSSNASNSYGDDSGYVVKPSSSYQPVRSPVSADVYNQAQPLNVYDVYEQSQRNQ